MLENARRNSIRMAKTLTETLEPRDQMDPALFAHVPHLAEPSWRLIRGTLQWCFEIWDWNCDFCGVERRGYHVLQVSHDA